MKADPQILRKALKRRTGDEGPSGAAPKKKAVRPKVVLIPEVTQQGASAPISEGVRTFPPSEPSPREGSAATFPLNLADEEVIPEADVGLVRKRKADGSADSSHRRKKKSRSRSSSVPRTPGSGEPPYAGEEPSAAEVTAPMLAHPPYVPPPGPSEEATSGGKGKASVRGQGASEPSDPEAQGRGMEPRLDRSPLVLPRREEGGLKALRGASSFHDPQVARRIARHIQLPKDRDEMSALSINALTDQAIVNSMKHLHEIIHLHDVIHAYSSHFTKFWSSTKKSEERMKEASGALQECRRELEATRLREINLRGALDHSRHNEEEARVRAEVAADKLEKALDSNKGLKVENAAIKEHVSELSSSLAEVKSRLSTHVAEVQRLEEYGTEAEIRATMAEARASDLEAEKAMLEKDLDEAKFQLDEAEEENGNLGSRLAELRTAGEEPPMTEENLKKAMDAYVASPEFQLELGECAADGFYKGFEECTRQVKAILPDFDVERLRKVLPDDVEDEEEVAEVGENGEDV